MSAAVWLALFGSVAAIAVAIAVRAAVRNRDPLPAAACLGAFLCAFNEPIFDVLAKLVYPHVSSRYVAYSAFGRNIPWSLMLGYIPWVGLAPYLISRRMAGGASRRDLRLIAGVLLVSVAGTEITNVAGLHGWRYYGQDAWRGVIGGGIVQMSAMPLLCALGYLILGEDASVRRRVLLGLLLPAMALPMTFAATTWPLYLANYSDIPEGARWACAAVAVGFCALAVLAITEVAERWSALGDPSAQVAIDDAGERDEELVIA